MQSQQTAQTLQEIGVLIDSIDANRQLLRTDVVEGTSYADYKSRLQDINTTSRKHRQKLPPLKNLLSLLRDSMLQPSRG